MLEYFFREELFPQSDPVDNYSIAYSCTVEIEHPVVCTDFSNESFFLYLHVSFRDKSSQFRAAIFLANSHTIRETKFDMQIIPVFINPMIVDNLLQIP